MYSKPRSSRSNPTGRSSHNTRSKPLPAIQIVPKKAKAKPKATPKKKPPIQEEVRKYSSSESDDELETQVDEERDDLPVRQFYRSLEPDQRAFYTMLKEVLAMDHNAIYVIFDNMFSSAEHVKAFDADNFYSFFKAIEKSPDANSHKVWISPIRREQIKSFHKWVQHREMIGKSYDPDRFTEEDIELTDIRTKQTKLFTQSVENQELKAPSKFKDFYKWIKFQESFKHYLSRILGVADCPLSYVIRGDDFETTANSETDWVRYFTANIKHKGTWYDADNARVWSELKAVVEGTGGWEFIKEFEKKRDGRGAYKELLRQGSSKNSTNAQILAAKQVYQETVWNGPKQNFTFDDFIYKYVTAFNTLDQLDNPIKEMEKVDTFLRNIHDTRADAAKDTCRGIPGYSEDFHLTYEFMRTILTKRKCVRVDRSAYVKRSRISSVSGDGGSRGSGGNKGFNGKIENKPYPYAQYRKFNAEQRAQLYNLRNPDGATRPDPRKRKVSSVSSDESEPEPKKPGNGVKFGSAAYGRKKPKPE